MGLSLTQVAVKTVEAVAQRVSVTFFPSGRIGRAESPFAEEGGFVSCIFFNYRCDCCFGKRQSFLSFFAVFFVSTNVSVTGMPAG